MPVGDVNCDLYVRDVDGHRLSTQRFLLKGIENFVCCEGSYLPFKNDVFDLVTSRQVIEHVKQPVLMLSEMVRTSKNLIVVETVHRRGERLVCRTKEQKQWNAKHHINKFDFTYFEKISSKLDCVILKADTTDSVPLIKFGFLTLMPIPFKIRIILQKKKRKEITSGKLQYLNSLGIG